MTETTFAAISTAAIFIGIVAWLVLSGRVVVNRRLAWIVLAGFGIIGLYTAMRLALPEAVQRPVVAVVGIALSGVMVVVALRYRDRLPPGQTRQMIGLAIVGAVLVVLGVMADAR